MLNQLAQPSPAFVSFEPILTVHVSLEDLAYRFRFHLEVGTDDLEDYKSVHLVDDSGARVVLMRYASMPADYFDLYVESPARRRLETALKFTDALGLPRDKVHKRLGYAHE